MRKVVLCLSLYLLSCVYHIAVSAEGNVVTTKDASGSAAYITQLYSSLDFSKCEKINPEVFTKAMQGYLNLKEANKLNNDKQILTVIDFTQSSSNYRFWIVDLKAKKVILNTYVAHGQGSGDDLATAFSNNENSHQSSIGFYVTGTTYQGAHGTSLRLNGMDKGYNSAALERGIVVHGADYVNKDFISGNQRLGRSWGCPAVASALAPKVIETIKDGTCMFIYYPDRTYLKTAYWLNKKVDNLPDAGSTFDPVMVAKKMNTTSPEMETALPIAPKKMIVARDTVVDFSRL